METSSSLSDFSDGFLSNLEFHGSAAAVIDDILETLHTVPLFGNLDYAEIVSLSKYLLCFAAPAGQLLISEGESGAFLLLVLTGKIEVLKRDTEHPDQEKKIAIVGPGTSLGEMSLLDGKPRFATCVTLAPTDIAVLSRESLVRLIEREPKLGARLLLILMQGLSERLRETTTKWLPFVGSPVV